MSFSLPEGYSWVLFSAVLISFHLLFTGFSAGSLRRSLFDKPFFEKNFPELKDNIPDSGYPDNGSGVFSHKLPLDKWMLFNCAQRCHMNYLEGIIPILAFLLVSGLVYTRLAFICGMVYLMGREMYNIGYKNKGASGRIVGALILDAALLVLFVASLMAAWNLGNGFDGMMKLVLGGK